MLLREETFQLGNYSARRPAPELDRGLSAGSRKKPIEISFLDPADKPRDDGVGGGAIRGVSSYPARCLYPDLLPRPSLAHQQQTLIFDQK